MYFVMALAVALAAWRQAWRLLASFSIALYSVAWRPAVMATKYVVTDVYKLAMLQLSWRWREEHVAANVCCISYGHSSVAWHVAMV